MGDMPLTLTAIKDLLAPALLDEERKKEEALKKNGPPTTPPTTPRPEVEGSLKQEG
jgi:hypothetical protein